MAADGPVRPYRPKPRDFRQKFIELGWDTVGEHYRASWKAIKRWVREEGTEELANERRKYLEQQYPGRKVPGRRPRTAAGRYVMGMTREPRPLNPELARFPLFRHAIEKEEGE